MSITQKLGEKAIFKGALNTYKQIIFPKAQQEALLAHCRRKMAEEYLPDEDRARKAYGLIGVGRQLSRLAPILGSRVDRYDWRRALE